jgi:hypothetical protein
MSTKIPNAKDLDFGGPTITASPPIDGAQLLSDLSDFMRRFIVLSREQADVLALWVAHTWAIAAASTTPYICVVSAEKRSGKTKTLEVSRLLVPRPWQTARTSVAALIRKLAADPPVTLLLDEGDALWRGIDEVAEATRAILNAGHSRDGVACLCVGVGANIQVQDFRVFSAKMLASIGLPPDTVGDRAVILHLRRRKPDEPIERLTRRVRKKIAPEVEDLRSRLDAWTSAHLSELSEAEPILPDALGDRQQDSVEPLLCVAGLAAGRWPERARKAVVAICAAHEDDSESLGVSLLRDAREIFAASGMQPLSSDALAAELAKIEGRPWAEFGRAKKPISKHSIAKLLRKFEVYSTDLWFEAGTLKGYRPEFFTDAWQRYLPAHSSGFSNASAREAAPTLNKTQFLQTQGDPALAFAKSASSPVMTRDIATLRLRNPENGQERQKTNGEAELTDDPEAEDGPESEAGHQGLCSKHGLHFEFAQDAGGAWLCQRCSRKGLFD